MHAHIIGILEQMRIRQDHIGIRPGIVGQRGWDDVCAGHLDKVHVAKGTLVHIESRTLELLLQRGELALPVKLMGAARTPQNLKLSNTSMVIVLTWTWSGAWSARPETLLLLSYSFS